MKTFIATVVSMLTGIGGHFINKRFDRALFFLLAFILCPVAIIVYQLWQSIYLSNPSGIWQPEATSILIAIATVWLLSVVVTLFDALRVCADKLTPWSITGGVGATISTLLGVLILIYSVWLGYFEFSNSSSNSNEYSYSSRKFSDPFFYEYINFGGADYDKAMIELPEGDGILAGRFTYYDQPAEGVKLTLTLNNTYESKQLVTDENGMFKLNLPEGEWYVNIIKTESWREKPSNVDDFVVVTGEEPALIEGNSYSSYSFNRSQKGKLILVTDQLKSNELVMTIKDELKIMWPLNKDSTDVVDIDNGVIDWESAKGATQYIVQLSEVELRASGSTSRPVSYRHVVGKTSLALNEYRTIQSSDEAKTYSVSIYAFDGENRYLNQSKRFHSQGLFELDNHLMILNDYQNSSFSNMQEYSDNDIEQVMDNTKRIKAIDVLIEEGLLNEAEALITKVNGKYEEGKLEAVKGYLAAERGDCVSANKLFNLALKVGDNSCVPKRYRESCN